MVLDVVLEAWPRSLAKSWLLVSVGNSRCHRWEMPCSIGYRGLQLGFELKKGGKGVLDVCTHVMIRVGFQLCSSTTGAFIARRELEI